MHLNAFAMSTLCAMLAGCAVPRPPLAVADLRQQVIEAERAFAKSMADRDPRAFAAFIAPDAVFVSGPKPLRGRQQVVDGWAHYFAKPDAPFSWEPADVEVLDSGELALSSGPVRDANGRIVARFTSTWRREAPGTWRIIFDNGSEIYNCPAQ